MAHGPQPLTADRGLQARMVAVCVFTPLLVIASVVAIALFVPLAAIAYFSLFLAFGMVAVVGAYLGQPYPRSSERREAPELHALVERVCAVADLPKPRIVVVPSRQPNSWVVVRPRYPARLFLTRGLLDLLDNEELEAVVAHELAHVALRDALVMTVVGAPGTLLFGGSLVLAQKGQLTGLIGAAVAMPSVPTRLATAALSRYREYTADASAVAITGKPMALAQALRKVSGTLERIPLRDLRALALNDQFNLVAAGRERAWLRTHPTIEQRVARIEELERGLHAARLPHPASF